MKVKSFVTSFSLLLLTWLAITFIYETPSNYFSGTGKHTLPISAGNQASETEAEQIAAKSNSKKSAKKLELLMAYLIGKN